MAEPNTGLITVAVAAGTTGALMDLVPQYAFVILGASLGALYVIVYGEQLPAWPAVKRFAASLIAAILFTMLPAELCIFLLTKAFPGIGLPPRDVLAPIAGFIAIKHKELFAMAMRRIGKETP